MALKDFFRKRQPSTLDPLDDLTLQNLKVGYFVDYDMKTYCVEGYNHYDWGSGDLTYEWQLSGTDETLYLEREPDDEDFWSLSQKIPIGKLGSDIISHIREHDDPPNEVQFEGTTFYLDEMGGGHFFKGGQGPGKEVLKWDYVDDSGKRYLSIEQWGDADFEAAVGHPVYEYQFDHILPGGHESD